jgi:hypothetical protein
MNHLATLGNSKTLRKEPYSGFKSEENLAHSGTKTLPIRPKLLITEKGLGFVSDLKGPENTGKESETDYTEKLAMKRRHQQEAERLALEERIRALREMRRQRTVQRTNTKSSTHIRISPLTAVAQSPTPTMLRVRPSPMTLQDLESPLSSAGEPAAPDSPEIRSRISRSDINFSNPFTMNKFIAKAMLNLVLNNKPQPTEEQENPKPPEKGLADLKSAFNQVTAAAGNSSPERLTITPFPIKSLNMMSNLIKHHEKTVRLRKQVRRVLSPPESEGTSRLSDAKEKAFDITDHNASMNTQPAVSLKKTTNKTSCPIIVLHNQLDQMRNKKPSGMSDNCAKELIQIQRLRKVTHQHAKGVKNRDELLRSIKDKATFNLENRIPPDSFNDHKVSLIRAEVLNITDSHISHKPQRRPCLMGWDPNSPTAKQRRSERQDPALKRRYLTSMLEEGSLTTISHKSNSRMTYTKSALFTTVPSKRVAFLQGNN